MRRSAALAIVVVSCAGALVSREARANGRFPAASQLVVAQDDPSFVVARTTFGIVVSRDRGTNWDWVCEAATGSTGSQDPSLGLLARGRLISGLYEGLSFSPDRGCNFSFANAALTKNVVLDVVVRREAPDHALALTSNYLGESDAGAALFTTQIFGTTDDGTTWAPFGTELVADANVETIEVAASDPHRLYVSGVRGKGTTSMATLFVSTDDGASWIERPIPIAMDSERAPFIAAVDPTNADRVYIRTDSDAGSRLLVTNDAGVTYTTAFHGVGQMLGFALSPDGSKVYLGGPDDGLWEAKKTDLTFTKRSAIHVQCLAANGTSLFACSDEVSGFILGSSEDDGATFAPKLHLATLRGPLACPSGSSESVCLDQWPPLHDALLGTVADSGAGSDDPDAGGTEGASSGNLVAGGGCQIGQRSDIAWLALLGVSTSVALALRRRRRSVDPK